MRRFAEADAGAGWVVLPVYRGLVQRGLVSHNRFAIKQRGRSTVAGTTPALSALFRLRRILSRRRQASLIDIICR